MTAPGTTSFDPIILERGITHDTTFEDWAALAYSPVGEVNAAMRDGDWKLVRPAINIAYASSGDAALDAAYVELDIEYKYHRENVTGIASWPEPVRVRPQVPPPELYNLAEDPGETTDLSSAEPARASAMLTRLETWFDDVEGERRSISPENHHPAPVAARFE